MKGFLSYFFVQVNLSHLSIRYGVEARLAKGMSTRKSIPYIQFIGVTYYRQYSHNWPVHIMIAYRTLEKLCYGGNKLFQNGDAR